MSIQSESRVDKFRKHIEQMYQYCQTNCGSGFDEIICYELHTQPINPRMTHQSFNGGYNTGLTFKELAQKWGISVEFLGELIVDHCMKLDD